MDLRQSPETRAAILAAALTCFLDKGYAATTIADIRKASGATTGSLYHFFAGKPALARALVETAVDGWRGEGGVAGDFETAVKASVRNLVRWGLAHPAQARFLEEMRLAAHLAPDLEALAALFHAGQAAAQARYAAAVAAGAVVDMPWAEAHALMTGAAYAYLRAVAFGVAAGDPAAADRLAEAAWSVVAKK